jgi:hypothetical protein
LEPKREPEPGSAVPPPPPVPPEGPPPEGPPTEGPPTDEDPPSLRGEIGATKAAFQRLIGAHVELAKAEFGDILDEVKKVSVLAGIAIATGISAGLLLAVGLPLFLGEWIFGSIGWGILHGLLLLTGIGIAAAVTALGIGGSAVSRALLIGVATAALIGVVLGLNLTNRAWGGVGDALLPLADAGARPLAAAVVVLPVVAAILIGLLMLVLAFGDDAGTSGTSTPGVGVRVPVALPTALYVGWLTAFAYSYSSRVSWPDLSIVAVGVVGAIVALAVLVVVATWRPGMRLITGLAIGTVTGVVLAGLTAVGIGPRVAAAIGVTIGLIAWLSMMGAEVARRGVDTEGLKNRFIPQKTIDITKETIEWVRARTPLSRRS